MGFSPVARQGVGGGHHKLEESLAQFTLKKKKKDILSAPGSTLRGRHFMQKQSRVPGSVPGRECAQTSFNPSKPLPCLSWPPRGSQQFLVCLGHPTAITGGASLMPSAPAPTPGPSPSDPALWPFAVGLGGRWQPPWAHPCALQRPGTAWDPLGPRSHP